MSPARPKPTRPYDSERLERAALHYVGRYATTQARLAAYLERKLKEQGWAGDGPPPIPAIVTRFAALGYVDDAAFARSRADSLARRGYGPRRIAAGLKHAGIPGGIREELIAMDDDAAEAAALAFARRRRIGPFWSKPADFREKQRAIAAMIRAGHDYDIARRVIGIDPADVGDGGFD